MTATTHRALWSALETVVESSTGLVHSDRVLDPNDVPQGKLHRLFSIEVQSSNTNKYRNQGEPGARVDADVILRCAWRLNPKSHPTTWRLALDDEEAAIRAVCSATDTPWDAVRRLWVSTRRRVNVTREWLFADVRFSIEFDMVLA